MTRNQWRAVGACGLATVLAALAASQPSSGAAVRMAAARRPAGTTSSTLAPAEAGSVSETTTTSTTLPVTVTVPPPGPVYAPVVGSVPVSPAPTPVRASAHPLLTDPSGDANVPTGPNQMQSDPSMDVTQLDVTADAATVTTTLRIADLGATPLETVPDGRPHSVVYGTVLFLSQDHYFSCGVERDFDAGTLSPRCTFWYPEVEAGYTGAFGGSDVVGVRGSVDPATGVVTLVADFAAMNAAMAADTSQSHAPVGLGTDVGLLGRTTAGAGTLPAREFERDYIQSDDPGCVYRLGD